MVKPTLSDFCETSPMKKDEKPQLSTRQSPGAETSQPKAEDFIWPLPPHFKLVPKIKLKGAETESCLIIMKEGPRRIGSLTKFSPHSASLTFSFDQAASSASVSFEEIQSMCLTDIVELVAVNFTEPSTYDPTYASYAKQKCVVNFTNGERFVSETVGFVLKEFGLFLFIISYGRTVLRWFIPAGAIADYQLGEQIGKMLVDKHALSPQELEAGLERQEQLRSPKIGDYLQKQLIVTQQQIEAALKRQQALPLLRLGDALLEDKSVTQAQLDHALRAQTNDRKKQLGEILIEMGAVNKETIKRVLAQKIGIPFVDLSTFQFDLALIRAVSGALVRKHSMIPLYRTELRMAVAMINPLASDAIKEMAFATKLTIDPVMASEEDMFAAIDRYYGAKSESAHIAELVSALNVDIGEPADIAPPVTESDSALVRLVNKIITDAFDRGVSDIHIESMKGNEPTIIRFRRDGVLADYSEVPANFRDALISRLKIMSRLDISEKRHAQDGKINFQIAGAAKFELRIVTIPTTDGLEDVVLRNLAAPRVMSVDSLGLAPSVLQGLQSVVARPHGLLLVCGPTGSGKTTTLHALLGYINSRERKIWTVENPIEITQKGLRQIQVNAKIDWTFASVLRSILRADPDVIMVGETRDPETAKTLIEASLTGHLVASTMHTNSAVESVIRMLDLGLDPFNFADALLGVLGQRLVRRMCPACRKSHDATTDELAMLAHEYCFETDLSQAEILQQWGKQYGKADGQITLYSASGCKECDEKGYRGRLGLHELLINTPVIRKMIHSRATVNEITSVAISQGMRTMRQDGIDKILQGITDWEQIKTI
jgi:type II secretory ATPase GspE/PulE/Tfp pilus assembly ATPase PilB-like protein